MADVADVNISKFVPTIKKILLDSDPYEITARDVRMKLQQEFKVDLSPRKLEVQHLIDRCYDDLDIGVEEVEEPIEPKVSKKQKKISNSEKKSTLHKPSKKSGNRGSIA